MSLGKETCSVFDWYVSIRAVPCGKRLLHDCKVWSLLFLSLFFVLGSFPLGVWFVFPHFDGNDCVYVGWLDTTTQEGPSEFGSNLIHAFLIGIAIGHGLCEGIHKDGRPTGRSIQDQGIFRTQQKFQIVQAGFRGQELGLFRCQGGGWCGLWFQCVVVLLVLQQDTERLRTEQARWLYRRNDGMQIGIRHLHDPDRRQGLDDLDEGLPGHLRIARFRQVRPRGTVSGRIANGGRTHTIFRCRNRRQATGRYCRRCRSCVGRGGGKQFSKTRHRRFARIGPCDTSLATGRCGKVCIGRPRRWSGRQE